MVDFNNDNTIGTPATDIIRVLILEKRTNIIEVLENINKREASDNYDTGVLRARIQSLYWEIEGMLKRKAEKDKDFKDIYSKLITDLFDRKTSLERLQEIFSEINNYLDFIRLTRIDNREQYDRRRVENVNKRSHI